MRPQEWRRARRACARITVWAFAGILFATGCQAAPDEARSNPEPRGAVVTDSSSIPSPPTKAPASIEMPDLIGLPAAVAGRRLGEANVSSSWGRPVLVRCGTRPGTVVWQRPAAGTPLSRRAVHVQVRTAALDLDVFRGPCNPSDTDPGKVPEGDARLARQFYRFAADPTLGASFGDGDVWVGIEDGLSSITVEEPARQQLRAWDIDTFYAEASGPFNVLDTLAGTGGYYRVQSGVVAGCTFGRDDPPPHLADLRAISLTAPRDVTSSCMDWWAVTLFLDSRDQVRGVALRMGSP